jgi:hypothetical protein
MPLVHKLSAPFAAAMRRQSGGSRVPVLLLLALAASLVGCRGSATPGSVWSSGTPTPTSTPTSTATPTSGTFSLTGSMAVQRVNFTATLLGDGRVLVAGGDGGTSSELFDPRTGRFTETGSMLAQTGGQSATLLPDGRVLMAGTGDTGGTELYDPASATFKPAGSMGTLRFDHTATLLRDGRVLIAGGGTGTQFLSTAEIYDPSTDRFTPTGSMKVARVNAESVLLQDGRVLVVGGDQGDAGMDQLMFASAEIYDPATSKFTSTGPMSEPRTHFAATRLLDGRVLVAGGYYASTETVATLASAEIYDPATGKFAPTGSMSVPRDCPTATLLLDGRVLLASGESGELYDPATGTFGPAAPFNRMTESPYTYTYGQVAVRLADGRVLLPGRPSGLYWP